MEASSREKHLKALGVVQYRRRSLTVINAAPLAEQTITESIKDSALVAQVSKTDHVSVINPVEAKVETPNKSVAADLVQELEQAKADLLSDTQGLENSKPAFGFDLLVWRSPKILVLEFSVVESEEITLKHRLANNILKALWPQEFNGVDLHQHSWPMPGVAADIGSATEWLNSLVTGHLQHENSMPIWVMGELGLKMLFPEQAESPERLSELMGSRMRHEKLDVELLISPSLKHISESVVAKVQVWQLLKPIR